MSLSCAQQRTWIISSVIIYISIYGNANNINICRIQNVTNIFCVSGSTKYILENIIYLFSKFHFYIQCYFPLNISSMTLNRIPFQYAKRLIYFYKKFYICKSRVISFFLALHAAGFYYFKLIKICFRWMIWCHQQFTTNMWKHFKGAFSKNSFSFIKRSSNKWTNCLTTKIKSIN